MQDANATAGELDEAFMSHVVAIRGHAARLGSRHEKIRIQKWLAALSEPMQQMVWKKNRNLHSMCLAEMLARGKVRPMNSPGEVGRAMVSLRVSMAQMEAPFTQMPSVPLQNFPTHLVARFSSLQVCIDDSTDL
jgi:hypothetical protein